AAIATFALKADVWFRRGLLLMLSPDSRANLARCQAEAPLIALCRFPKPALKSCLSERANAPPIFKILVALNLNVKYEARGARAPISFRWVAISPYHRPTSLERIMSYYGWRVVRCAVLQSEHN